MLNPEDRRKGPTRRRGDRGELKIGAEIFALMEQLTELTASNADQASLMELRAELDTVSTMVSQMAREESVQAVQQRWDEFEARIADRIELDSQAKRDLRVETTGRSKELAAAVGQTPLVEIGEAVVVAVRAADSTVRVTVAKTAITTGDLIAPIR